MPAIVAGDLNIVSSLGIAATMTDQRYDSLVHAAQDPSLDDAESLLPPEPGEPQRVAGLVTRAAWGDRPVKSAAGEKAAPIGMITL